MARQGKLVSASVVASLLLVAGLPVGSALATPFDGYDHVVHVDDVAGLLANAGRSSTAVVLADESVDPGGDYVIPPCPDGVDERTDPTCGMIVLGPGSGLFGNGRNELIGAEPTGNAAVSGPLIDCGALELTPDDWGPGDINGWDLACVEMTSGTISGVRIDNGPDAVPQLPGQGGEHRNGILVQPGDGEALIEHTLVTDVRRGVLAAAGTDMVTEVTAHANIVRRTELAGLFVLPAQIPTVPVERARVEAAFTANHMDDIGRIGINVAWGIGEGGVHVDADLVDNVVADAFIGLAVFGEGFLTSEYSVGHTVAVSARGGQISARGVGTALLAIGLGPEPNSVNNSLKLEMSDVTFGPTFGPAFAVQYDPWGPGNEFVAELAGNHYTGGEPGVVDVCAFSYETFGCVDPGSDPPFQFAGTRDDLTAANTNFTFDSVDDAHFGWRSPRPPRPQRP